MSYDRASVLEAYGRTSSLRAACAETGCPPYVAYIWCKKAGVLALHDKTRYGTRANQMGALAEKEFQRLVPRAMPANATLDPNCPAFDFDVDGITSARTSSGCTRARRSRPATCRSASSAASSRPR